MKVGTTGDLGRVRVRRGEMLGLTDRQNAAAGQHADPARYAAHVVACISIVMVVPQLVGERLSWRDWMLRRLQTIAANAAVPIALCLAVRDRVM